MDNIFKKIIDGKIPCHKVYEDDRVLAFLDVEPLSRGHTLVIPKEPARFAGILLRGRVRFVDTVQAPVDISLRRPLDILTDKQI